MHHEDIGKKKRSTAKQGIIYHGNRLLSSHRKSRIFFFQKMVISCIIEFVIDF